MIGSYRQHGFTLIELVVILVIAGILTAYILPRLATRSSFDERVFRDEIISTARYAQQLAMMRGRGYTIRFRMLNASRQYGIDQQQGANPAVWLNSADAKNYPLAYPNAISTSPATINVSFNALGSESNNTATTININGVASNIVCIDASGYAHLGAC